MKLSASECPVCGSKKLSPLDYKHSKDIFYVEIVECLNSECETEFKNRYILADQIIIDDPHGLYKPPRIMTWLNGPTAKKIAVGFILFASGYVFCMAQTVFQMVR